MDLDDPRFAGHVRKWSLVGDEADIDLVERCKAGDRAAYAALIGFWTEPAMSVASILAGDNARDAFRDALVECWGALPTSHSETPLRAWLLGAVARAAIAQAPSEREEHVSKCLDQLDERARIAAVLNLRSGMHTGELAHAMGTNAGSAARVVRSAVKRLGECLNGDAKRALQDTTARQTLSRRWVSEVTDSLTDPVVYELRRVVRSSPREAWTVIADASQLPAWASAEGVHILGGGSLHVGARIAARGRIADRRLSRDESLITRLEPHDVLAWMTHSRIPPYPDAIEFRWSLAIEPDEGSCTIVHRLHGVAFPPGAAGTVLHRAYTRIEDSMHTSMHRGLERLASLVEARART
jgi:DNA-directed RNA polymerase specialized sigma24 family protein